MKLDGIFMQLKHMTDEELQEKIREVRHNKYVLRPAHIAKKEKAVRKEGKKATASVTKQIANLSPEEKLKLIQQLQKMEAGNAG